jgi:prevent-host-death family protein
MMVKSISEAKANLSALIERTRNGEEVIIGKAGKPVAVLTRYSPGRGTRKPGALKGRIKIADDFDVLPYDIAAAFGIAAESREGYGDSTAC